MRLSLFCQEQNYYGHSENVLLKHLEYYLKIQNYRFGDRIHSQVIVDDDIISIENIICSNEEYNIFSALDFRKNSENNFLKFYYIETLENNTIDNILTEILSK